MSRDLLPYQLVVGLLTAALGGIAALLGELRDEYGFSNSEVGLVVSAGFLAAFVAQISLAPFADRGHARAMTLIGLTMATVALAGMIIADSLLAWVLLRALLGFGSGLVLPGMRRAASVLNPDKVGENLGRLVVGEVIGFMVGPVVAATFATIGDITAPFAALAVMLALFLPFAARLPPDKGRLDIQHRHAFDLLQTRRFVGALVLVAAYFVLVGAFEAVIPLMFRDRGASTLTTGLAFALLGLPVAFTARLGGRMADRIGPPKVAVTAIVILGLVTSVYGFLPGITLLVIVMFLVGAVDGIGIAATQVAVARAVPETRQAGALGLMGATEVGVAGLSAIPAAFLYDHIGENWTWVIVGVTALAIVTIGHFLIRGTSPASTAGPRVVCTDDPG